MKKLKTVKITRQEVQDLINKIPFTAFFGATFVKKDGSVRKMNCNRSISTGLKNQRKQTTVTTSLINVYDVNAKGYRYVNLDTVTEIRANGKVYIIQ